MKLINKVIEDLEEALRLRREDLGDSVMSDNKIEINVLGQMSLLMNEEVSSKIRLAYTKDVDALLKGKWGETQVFRDVLKSNGLAFDELSTEIWIPKDSNFIQYYDSTWVKVSHLDPISAITSKAIKAKEKNKHLVSDALKLFGDVLASKIISNGGDITYFTITKTIKL
jgi:hypothetical protein